MLTSNLVSKRLALGCSSVENNFLSDIIHTKLQYSSSVYGSAMVLPQVAVLTGIVNQSIETFDMRFNQFLQSSDIRSVGRRVSECPLPCQCSESGMIR